MMGSKAMPLSRIFDYVEIVGECHLFRGTIHNKGYGRIGHRGKMYYAHRIAWEMKHGKIPEGLTIDHLCRNRNCINTNHMELVTNKVNVLRGVGLTAQNKDKTNCIKGHPFSEENVSRLKKGHRGCKACERERYHRRMAGGAK